jgi:hypothetical protein
MQTANAYNMLILPMLQYTLGIIATFSILHWIGAGVGRLVGQTNHRDTRSYRNRSTRRSHVLASNSSR